MAKKANKKKTQSFTVGWFLFDDRYKAGDPEEKEPHFEIHDCAVHYQGCQISFDESGSIYIEGRGDPTVKFKKGNLVVKFPKKRVRKLKK